MAFGTCRRPAVALTVARVPFVAAEVAREMRSRGIDPYSAPSPEETQQFFADLARKTAQGEVDGEEIHRRLMSSPRSPFRRAPYRWLLRRLAPLHGSDRIAAAVSVALRLLGKPACSYPRLTAPERATTILAGSNAYVAQPRLTRGPTAGALA